MNEWMNLLTVCNWVTSIFVIIIFVITVNIIFENEKGATLETFVMQLPVEQVLNI